MEGEAKCDLVEGEGEAKCSWVGGGGVRRSVVGWRCNVKDHVERSCLTVSSLPDLQ